MADDHGRVVKRNYQLGMGISLEKPIFFNHAIYAICRVPLTNWIDTYKIQLDSQGAAQSCDLLPESRTELLRCWNSTATCFFDGRVYLFFDCALEGDSSKFEIRYKTTDNPERGWAPPDPNGIGTGINGTYVDWGARGRIPSTISVRELGGKLFLFYHASEFIHYSIFDGKEWKHKGALHKDKYYPIMSTCAASVKGRSVIIYAGFPINDDRKMYLTEIDADGVARPLGERIVLEHAQWNNLVGIAHGTVKDGTQDNVLQIFCQNYGGGNPFGRTDLRRVSVNLETLERGEWFDSTLTSDRGYIGFCTCDVVNAAVSQSAAKGDFRQHTMVLTSYPEGAGRAQTVASYSSDYFKCEFTSDTAIDTGHQDSLQPGAWALLGVVEGVPPFTRNGVPSKEPTSSVEYGESTTNKVTIGHKFETSVSANVGGGFDKIFEVSVELSSEFSVANEMTKTISRSFDISMVNKERNQEGNHGWMVISKPSLRGRRYTRFASGMVKHLGSFLVVSVEDASISIEPYQLEKPPTGMQKREPSANLKYWFNAGSPRHDEVDQYPLNALLATLTGGNIRVSLKIANSEKRTTRAAGKVKLAAKGTKFLTKLFKIDAGANATFSYATTDEVTSEFSQNISANLKILDPAQRMKDTVTRLAVKPTWFVAKAGAVERQERAVLAGHRIRVARPDTVVPHLAGNRSPL